MANVDEKLMARTVLRGADEQRAAEHELIAQRSRTADEEVEDDFGGENEEEDVNQQIAQARNLKGSSVDAAGGTAVSAAIGTSLLLKNAWLNIIDSFGLTLIYINLHVFGNSVFGKKIFCDLGEEWIPSSARSKLGSETVKNKIKAFGLLEKILLILADLIVLIILLALVTFIIWIVNPWNIVSTVVSPMTGGGGASRNY
jgi:hypothetical protein